MKSIYSVVTVIISLFISFNTACADNFDIRGYRQGMSRQEINKYALENNQIIKQNDKDSDYINIYQGDSELINLQLCNNKVYRAFWTVSGKLDKYIKQLEQLTKQGMLKRDVSWSTMIGYDGNEHFDLTVYFINPGSENDFYVKVTLFASEKYGTTNYQVTYETNTGYCK